MDRYNLHVASPATRMAKVVAKAYADGQRSADKRAARIVSGLGICHEAYERDPISFKSVCLKAQEMILHRATSKEKKMIDIDALEKAANNPYCTESCVEVAKSELLALIAVVRAAKVLEDGPFCDR